MKASFLFNALTLMLVTTAAEASYFQVNCSNADGSISSGSGHSQNYVQLTKYSYDNNGPKKELVRFERGQLHQQSTLKSVKLVSEQKQACHKTGEGGFSSSRVVSASVVTFVNADGSLFDAEIMGVSKDRKTVKAELICETNVNNMIFCPKN
jgi:hypothetical protein